MTVTSAHPRRIGLRDRLSVPRSRGAASGFLLILLGLWGALIPLVGPLFNFSFTPDDAWNLTGGRFWLEVLPGAATFVGGLILLGSANRVSGWLGAWLAVAGGAWFAVGQAVSQLWNNGTPLAGVPAEDGVLRSTLEQLTFFSGLGVLVVFLGATALGRLSVIGIRDLEVAQEDTVAPVVTDTRGNHLDSPTGDHVLETDRTDRTDRVEPDRRSDTL